MAPEVFHGLLDPLGSAQVHRGILTSIGFPKGTTKILRNPRLSWHQSIPRNTWKSGSTTSNTITIMHHFTCYFSVITIAYDDGTLEFYGEALACNS